jgi:hypothetical protein
MWWSLTSAMRQPHKHGFSPYRDSAEATPAEAHRPNIIIIIIML